MLVIPNFRMARALHNFDCPMALTVLPLRRPSVTTDAIQMRPALEPRTPAASMGSGGWNRAMAHVRERHRHRHRHRHPRLFKQKSLRKPHHQHTFRLPRWLHRLQARGQQLRPFRRQHLHQRLHPSQPQRQFLFHRNPQKLTLRLHAQSKQNPRYLSRP
jgi:ABC-type Zn2+ transport system substrate-binding protein/surface adhesin